MSEQEELINLRLVRFHIVAGLLFLGLVIFAGLLYSLQFLRIYPLAGIELFSPGRVRMVHTSAAVFGFLTNGFVAGMYWVVPRMTGFRVLNEKIFGWVMFVALQLSVLAAAIGILTGHAQGIEWGETPIFIDPFIVTWLIMCLLQFATPIYKYGKEKPMYAGAWYLLAGLIWIPMVYIMGNYIPQFFVPGVAGAAITGTWIHDAVGLYITPLGWGLMYYFVPVILKKPIWSHSLSILGFWGLAFFYPMQGVHHYLWSPIPMFSQYAAITSTLILEMAVITVIVNFFMTLKGSVEQLKHSIPLRWIMVGILNYAITCIQCASQVLLTTQQIIHFTDWVVGHAHLIMFGTFGLWVLGFFTYLWPRVTGNELYSQRLSEWSFWLIMIGIELMWIDLLSAGLVQGYVMWGLNTWIDYVNFSIPFWAFRTFTGLLIASGFIIYLYNFVMTCKSKKTVTGLQPQTV